MKAMDYREPEEVETRHLANETAYPAEEFIGLDGVGEFPEWRSPEVEEELSIQTRRIA